MGDDEQTILMETVGHFAQAEKLPVRITLIEGLEQVHMGLGVMGDAGVEMKKFPAFTRFSLDNGNSYYMLYDENMISLDPQSSGPVSVLLDLANVELPNEENLFLVTEGYAGQELISSANKSVKPDIDALIQMESRLLARESALKITLPKSWKDYTLAYSVEMLTANGTVAEDPAALENAVPEYIAVDLTAQSLIAEYVTDEETCALVFQLGETLPPAGTYRVSMNWTYEGICFAQAQTTFFINYLEYSESDRTGGAEQ